jgi:hypothetical protein
MALKSQHFGYLYISKMLGSNLTPNYSYELLLKPNELKETKLPPYEAF